MCRPVIDFTVVIVPRHTFTHTGTHSSRNSLPFLRFVLLKYKVSGSSAVVKAKGMKVTGVGISVALLMGERT
jgi:hypothetical protein